MSIGKINLFLLKLLNLFLALHQKCRTTISSFLFSRTEKRKMRLHRIFLLLKNNDWRRSPAEPPRSRPSGRRRRCAVQAFWPLSKTLAQAEFTSAEHCNRRRVKAAKPPKPKTKSVAFATAFCFGGDNTTKICDLTRWRRSPAERSRIAKEPHLLVWFFAWWRQQNSNL